MNIFTPITDIEAKKLAKQIHLNNYYRYVSRKRWEPGQKPISYLAYRRLFKPGYAYMPYIPLFVTPKFDQSLYEQAHNL